MRKAIKKVWEEFKRVLPLIAIILIAIFIFGDVEQLIVQLYKLSSVAMVVVAVNIVRQWLFPYIDLKKIVKHASSSQDKLPAAIIFAAVMAFIIAFICISVI